MNTNELTEVLYLQRLFSKLYVKTGLLALASDYVQVTPATLLQIAKENKLQVSLALQTPEHKEITVSYKGVRFLAVLTLEKAKKLVPELLAKAGDKFLDDVTGFAPNGALEFRQVEP